MSRIYTTISGDTWDLIAYQQMGDEKYMKNLLAANLPLSEVLRFDAGTKVIIPDLTVETSDNLPFWHSTDDNSIWGAELDE